MSAQHATVADTMPNPGEQPGGSWLVVCTCGWERSEKYARDGGEAIALRLANILGFNHENAENAS